ncbi:hypothetical protein HanRHA438_Chr06g0251231 [Helianthus annuus]|nr:hypothetical protein HanRHA438_Chr06g0251231 [Helianthus annuus]
MPINSPISLHSWSEHGFFTQSQPHLTDPLSFDPYELIVPFLSCANRYTAGNLLLSFISDVVVLLLRVRYTHTLCLLISHRFSNAVLRIR